MGLFLGYALLVGSEFRSSEGICQRTFCRSPPQKKTTLWESLQVDPAEPAAVPAGPFRVLSARPLQQLLLSEELREPGAAWRPEQVKTY